MAATRSCGLATEFSPLPKTKIGKKDEQLTEKQQFRVTAVISWLSPEIFPLAQNENSKKERTTYRKTAISGNGCYKLVEP